MQRIMMPERIHAVNAAEVEAQLADIVTTEPKVLICDFSQSQLVTSSGVRIILIYAKKMVEYGGKMHLANLSGSVLKTIEMANLGAIIEIIDE